MMRIKDKSKHSLYIRMYEAAKKENNSGSFLKMVFNGVMAVNTLPYKSKYTREQIEVGCPLTDEVMELLKQATPRQIMQVFPIHKEYDGTKWGEKDYFYTMDYLKGIYLDKPLGDELEEFLWHYYNWNVMMLDNIYHTYQREKEYQEHQDKIDSFNKETSEKFEEIQRIGELITQEHNIIDDSNKRISVIKEKMQGRPRIINFMGKIKLKKMEYQMHLHVMICDSLIEYMENLMAEYASIEGWDEAIEELFENNREEANRLIIMRNKMLNKCYL